ncbi:hypothetical protein Leryth_006660 [Lithospermum erythrorhizon]|nr:hypothetical protein Leryth_006660 [Lithospermum erythrorhizon]
MEPPLTPTPTTYIDDMDSTCSTPYVSAPSSPGREPPSCGGVGGGGGYHYYYSAPASPMHFLISSQNQIPFSSEKSTSDFNDFDFSATLTNPGVHGLTSSGPMSSADELFFNGQIRPMKLSSHLQRPQMLTPLTDGDENDQDFDENVENMENDDVSIVRGRDMKLRSHSLRRRTRSLSPLRSTSSFDWHQDNDDFAPHKQNDHFAPGGEEIVVETEVGNGEGGQIGEDVKLPETTTSGSSSRSSSVGRSSKRWVLLKEFLYRSKSEGRSNGQRFWGNLSFSPVTKDKKLDKLEKCEEKLKIPKMKSFSKVNTNNSGTEGVKKKRVNGIMRKRRMGAHEIHYTANRAQAEEMRKKTFLPYRQGLLGCLGFSSRSYGAWNGFTRALNPVSSS